MPLEKATLTPLPSEPGGVPVEFMFNPTMLSIARSVKWQSETGNRGNSALPKVNFSGVDPYKLTLSQIVFDTYETLESVVEKYIKKLKKGVESPDGQKQRPPVYVLNWGQNKTFPCVMTSLTYKLDMFLSDGTPVRALVDIALQEVDKDNLPGDKQPTADKKARQQDSRSSREKNNQPPAFKPNRGDQSDF